MLSVLMRAAVRVCAFLCCCFRLQLHVIVIRPWEHSLRCIVQCHFPWSDNYFVVCYIYRHIHPIATTD